MSSTSEASEREDCVDSDLAAVTGLSAPTYDLTDKESSSSFTAQSRLGLFASSKQTNLVSPLSAHPSKPSLSLLPTASNESTPSITKASNGTSSSTESCKTPVAARSDIVIAMDFDDGKKDNSRDKSKSEELSDDKDDAIIDIMGSDNDDEKMSTINEKSSQGKLLLVRPSRFIINYS